MPRIIDDFSGREIKVNPRTRRHENRLARAKEIDDAAVDACWTCGFPLHLVDIMEPFRHTSEHVYCSECVAHAHVRTTQDAERETFTL